MALITKLAVQDNVKMISNLTALVNIAKTALNFYIITTGEFVGLLIATVNIFSNEILHNLNRESLKSCFRMI